MRPKEPSLLAFAFAIATLGLSSPVVALGVNFSVRVAMREKTTATFYVPATIVGYGSIELLVDTGSGYTTINQRTLDVLAQAGGASYLRKLRGVLADGSTREVPVYAVSGMSIGGDCWLHDVEAAVLPGESRQILGLSALRKASPFIFSVDPPILSLSGCLGAAPPSAVASEHRPSRH